MNISHTRIFNCGYKIHEMAMVKKLLEPLVQNQIQQRSCNKTPRYIFFTPCWNGDRKTWLIQCLLNEGSHNFTACCVFVTKITLTLKALLNV